MQVITSYTRYRSYRVQVTGQSRAQVTQIFAHFNKGIYRLQVTQVTSYIGCRLRRLQVTQVGYTGYSLHRLQVTGYTGYRYL